MAGFCRSQQRYPSDGPFHFWRNGFLHRSRRWHCPQGVLPARSAFPPIHFGREEGVERTLLRVACQSETFLASPWQGDANIRFLWHIGCQSDFDELVSMACRPVDRGFCGWERLKNIQPRTRTPCPNKDTLLKRQPRSNEDIPPKPGHHAQTRTSQPEPGHPRPNEAVWKIFVKFAGITGLRK